MAKILIVDDEKSIRNSLREILEYEGYQVKDACDGLEGYKMASEEKFDIILSDIKMPKMDGIELLDKLKDAGIDSQIVMISGHGTIETAVEAIRNGAFDFIAKPLDLNRVLITLKNALANSTLVKETTNLKKKVLRSNEIIGESEAINSIKSLIEKVAPTDARVLITGENGTGKELVARMIHELSPRNVKPIVEVNCAAIPSELIESELFGHEKGAFTSAIKQRIGKFEQAHEGTLFLDEIGDMSPSTQAKVLRALQENKITRVGGEKEISVNVRVIAATNKNLKQEIENGNFREDLYHRLSVILIKVPTLNERSSDIPLIATHFMKVICIEHRIQEKTFSKDALKGLQELRWTGNIRELRNVIERLIILCGNEITAKDIKLFASK